MPTGYDLVFYDDFESLTSIDMANSQQAGFNWYREQWWGNGTTNVDSIHQSGSVITLGGGTGRGRLQSALAAANANHYVGHVWSGGGYFEFRMRFNPANTNISGNFGIYAFSIENIYDLGATGDGQWPGQASGYGHFAELDCFELSGYEPDGSYNGHHTFQGTIHDFSGTFSGGWAYHIYNSNSLQDVGAAPDWTQFHTYAVEWVPQSGSTPGHAQWFFDDRPLNSCFWLGPPGNPPLPGQGTAHGAATTVSQTSAGTAGRTFSILDQTRGLAFQLDGNSALPIEIDWVRIWKPVVAAPPSGATVGSWPGGLRGPAEFDIWPENPNQVTTGEGSELGWTETLTGFTRLRCVVTWNLTTPAQALAIEAALTRLRGRRTAISIPNDKYDARIGTATGTWTVNGFHRADAERVHLTGGSGSFAPGDWIEISQIAGVPRAYLVLGFAGGIAQIGPALHDNVTSGTAVKHLGDGTTTRIHDAMEMVSKVGPATIFPALNYGAVNRRSAEFVSYRRTVVVASTAYDVTELGGAVTDGGVAVTVTL